MYADFTQHAAAAREHECADAEPTDSREACARADAYFRARAVITPLSAAVDDLNAQLLQRLPAANETVSYSTDKLVKQDDDVDPNAAHGGTHCRGSIESTFEFAVEEVNDRLTGAIDA